MRGAPLTLARLYSLSAAATLFLAACGGGAAQPTAAPAAPGAPARAPAARANGGRGAGAGGRGQQFRSLALLADDSGAFHLAMAGRVVHHRVVLGRSVVPHRHAVRLPAETHLVLGDERLADQVLEQLRRAGRLAAGDDR